MKHLVLLHGAVGSKTQMEPLQQQLQSHYVVHNLDLPGHGGLHLPEEFSIPFFADYVASYCSEQGINDASFFGYSMGGYVAMFLAKQQPAMVEKLVTLGTKFQWDATIAAHEMQMLLPDVIEKKLPQFAKVLQQRHHPADWKQVLAMTAAMLQKMGGDNPIKPADYGQLQVPTLLMVGDRDKTVTLEETVAVSKALPSAQLCVLPGTPHPIEKVDAELTAQIIRKFLM